MKKNCLTLLLTLFFIFSFSFMCFAEEKKITLNINTDFVTAVRLIANYAGVEVVVNADNNENKNIVANIKNQPVSKALQRICNIMGYDCVKADDKIYYIGSYADTKKLSLNSSITEVIPLNYVKTEDISAALQKDVIPNNVTVSLNKSSNSVILVGPKEENDRVKKIIKGIDKELDQIYIQAEVYEIADNDAKDLGIVYNDQESLISTNISEIGNGDGNSLNSNLLSFGKFARSVVDFQIKLDALVTAEKAKMLCNPNVIAMHNKEASIFIGEKLPYSSVTAINGGTQQDTSYLDVGVELKVTPIISDDNIKLDITTEIQELIGTDAKTGSPITSRRFAKSTLKVQDNTPIIIGGLTKENITQSNKKIALLGDIPLLGNIFKWKETSNKTTEVLIILTPKIVSKDGIGIVPNSFQKKFPKRFDNESQKELKADEKVEKQ